MNRNTEAGKYFLAFIPPAPIAEEALQWKNYFKDKYGSKAALSSPPHITLHMPFEWKVKKEEKLISQLQVFASNQSSMNLSLNGFDCFSPRVIFIHVEKTETLAKFQKELERFCRQKLNLLNSQYRDLPYHPHLTLAFRDLKKEKFQEAWAEFEAKKYSSTFLADRITLLKHDGKRWNSFQEFLLA